MVPIIWDNVMYHLNDIIWDKEVALGKIKSAYIYLWSAFSFINDKKITTLGDTAERLSI